MVICFYYIHTEIFDISIQKLVANDCEYKSFDQSKTRTIVLQSVNFGIDNIQYLKTPRNAFAGEEGVFFLRIRLAYNQPYLVQNCASIISFTRFTEMLLQWHLILRFKLYNYNHDDNYRYYYHYYIIIIIIIIVVIIIVIINIVIIIMNDFHHFRFTLITLFTAICNTTVP